MYAYPPLSPQDSKLAYNIFMLNKAHANVYQLDEVKRKPLKKKITKKIVATPPTIEPQQQRACICCGIKAANNHKC